MIQTDNFNILINGEQVSLFTLKNKNGMMMQATNFGAIVASLFVPNKNGEIIDVVLGHDSIEAYLSSPEKYLGAAIGRYANRIRKGSFFLNERQYNIPLDNPDCSLHGGPMGFHCVVWNAKQTDEATLEFSYTTQDMEEGFPGNVQIKMIYQLTEKNEFKITYHATTDKTTVINLTHHSYFNLNGAGNDTITNHIAQINADFFTPIDKKCIPTGEILSVEGTPMDFRTPSQIGQHIDENFQQLIFGLGYDHNYVVKKNQFGKITFAAQAESPETGIRLKVYSTQPGVQLYTGNWLSGFPAKHGQTYGQRSGFCFETQHFADSPNLAHFPSTILNPGEEYNHTCIYAFETTK